MITCSACAYDQNPDNAEFCGACGSELQTLATPVIPVLAPTVIQPEIPPPISTPAPFPIPTNTTARLIAKQSGSPVPEFTLESNAIVGVFDPDMGPVEVDLEAFFGGETVSRNHAEIYQEGGMWKVKDLGSTNGVFIKPLGQTRFGARITIPETLSTGDEVAFGKVRFLFQTS
ncbi:FHA domain containing protein (plasmid) [Nostoc linckia NIES-25]|nr:FHA domain containing protein [Nostoc linckia NIES-25]